jgi:hypothetical protein
MVFAWGASQNWLVLKSSDHAIVLFQGMFEKNILTFNNGAGQHHRCAPMETLVDQHV